MGAFDDLIPEKKRGAFDDLIPKTEIDAADRATRRYRDQASFGLLNAPGDAFTAAANTALGRGDEGGLGAEYARQRAKTRAALHNDELNAPDVAADTAGQVTGAILTAPLTAARAVGEGSLSAYQAAKNAIYRQLTPKEEGARIATEVGKDLTKKEAAKQIGRESARVGGAIGVAGGYSHSPDNADLGDTLLNMGEEGFGGAAIGRVLPPIIDKTGQAIHWAKNKLTRPSAAAGERARAAAADVEATGGQEFAPELGGPMVGATASGLSGTVLGGPVRQGARMSLDALEARIQQEIQAAGGAGTPEQVGQRAQEFIRHNVTERSRTPEEVNAMGPLELHGISGVPPGPGQEIPPPRVPPTLPRELPPVRPADVVEEMVANTPPVPPKPVTDLEGRYKPPTPDEVELAPEMVKKVQKAAADVSDLSRRLEAEKANYDANHQAISNEVAQHGYLDVYPSGGGGLNFHKDNHNGTTRISLMMDHEGKILTGGIDPEEAAMARKVFRFMRDERMPTRNSIAATEEKLQAAQREREIVQREMEAFRRDELPKLAEQRRQEALADATKANEAEASVATQKAKEGARAKASAEANQIAMQRTQQARDFEAERAARATEARQHEANQAHEAQLQAARADLGEPVQPLGRSPEHTYPTEIDAAYAANRANMPDMRRNVLGRKGNQERPAEHTETSQLLDQFGQEARRRDLFPGYRDGQPFAADGSVHPTLLNYLRERLGDRITDRLAVLGERRAKGQFAPGVQGLQDLRTTIDREIARVRRPPPAGMGQHREDYGMLARLRQTVDRDIEQFSRGAGREGEVYRRQREQIDAANRQLEQEIQPALKNVFGAKVEPQEALRNLVEATQNGTNNFSTLRNFYRVVNDKGDRLRATSWLLNDMTRDGIPGFLKAYRGISPDARALMQEAAPDLMRFLDAAARRGGRLERFTKTASDDYGSDLGKWAKPANLAIGSLGYLLGVPGVLAQVVGGAGLSKVMASKWFAGWLKSYPVTRSPTDPRIAQHLNRLYALSSESLGLNKEAAQGLKDALLPGKARALFVGEEAAKPEDRPTLEKAKELEAQKSPPEKIWKDTGWGTGKDSKRRFELNDQDATITDAGTAAFAAAKKGQKDTFALGDILDHPHLYDYAPEAAKVRVSFGNPKNMGSKAFPSNAYGSYGKGEIYINADRTKDPEELRSVLLHEVQHLLGEKYKFPYGDYKKTPYEKLPGEVEARDVELRRDLSWKQRRQDLPGMMKLGGPAPLEAGDSGVQKVLFTGESSKTADKDALAKAKGMDGNAKPDEIWKRTGWYKSKDGEWNNEIDDSQAKFKVDPSLVAGRKPRDYLETTLGKVIDHPGLFAAHPHLSSMPIRLYNANELPDEGGGASTMLPSKSNPRGYIELPIASTDPDDMGILLHEINHALEPENNFDYGPFEGKYKNRQGEVKARNVQTRQEMTASQRRASYPPSTEDVKWPHVLVRSKEERHLSETADDEDNIHAAHLPGYKMRLGGPRIDLESLPMDDQGNVRDLQSNIDRITDRGGFSSSPSAQRVLNMGGPIYRYNSLRARLKQRWNGKGSVPKRYE